ncbi:hypothetical protein WA026_005600 [Henosepilachna vigintioctopunctata]|uniref:Uncharacterized protein n=1 Tax=Henosepilachna vigintioctopunctata TaxID=420089 RepID=A0AAW1U2B1_9CUCU
MLNSASKKPAKFFGDEIVLQTLVRVTESGDLDIFENIFGSRKSIVHRLLTPSNRQLLPALPGPPTAPEKTAEISRVAATSSVKYRRALRLRAQLANANGVAQIITSHRTSSTAPTLIYVTETM